MSAPEESDMESQSFDTMTSNIQARNREAMDSQYETMPTLINHRSFPRNINRDTDEGPDWFPERYVEYHDGESQFVPKKPDPWYISEGLPDDFLADREDFYVSWELGKQWMNFLQLPPTTLIMIRSLLNMIIDSVENTGYRTPIGVTRVFSDYIIKNFPDDIPRTETNPPLPDIEDELTDISDLIEVYNDQLKNGLKTRKNFVNFNKWQGRRNNYNNWTKFCSIMKDLASDLGPFSHNLINTVNESIDRILANQHLNTEAKVITINEFTTSARKWALFMFITPPVINIKKGRPVVIKNYVPANIEIALRAIIPKIMERENEEQLVADADNVSDDMDEGPAQNLTLSIHEEDSGNVSALPRDNV